MSQLWLDRLAGKAGLDVGPVRPLRPVTIAKWRFAVRQMASALVQSGRQPATLTGLADLVTRRGRGGDPGLLPRARRQPALCADPGPRRPAQGDRRASCRGGARGPGAAAAHGAAGDAAGAGHDRQEPRHAAAVRRSRHAAAPGQPAGRAVRQAADGQCPAQAAGAAPAVGLGGRAPAGGADAAEEPRRPSSWTGTCGAAAMAARRAGSW